jgi:hypothetical protein
MRALRVVLIIAVVLGGLFVAADRIAVAMAENQAAKKIRSSQDLNSDPDVSIKGFPFLTQVAEKQLDEVDVDLKGITASAAGRSIRLSEVSAQLHDVTLKNNFSPDTADSATGTAHLSYEDLSKAAGSGIKIAYGGHDAAGKGQVKVTARISIPLVDETFKGSVVSTVSVLNGDTIRLRAESIPGLEVPGLEKIIREKIDFERKIAGLPKGLKLDKVVATEQGVDISVTGHQVKMTELA